MMVFERHHGTAKYINDFAGNLKRNLGKGIKRVRHLLFPLIPTGIVDTLRRSFNDQSFALNFEADPMTEEVLNLRSLQITNERNPS